MLYPMGFIEEIEALTAERVALTERVRALRERHGVSEDIPAIVTDTDEEARQLITDWENFRARDAAFWEFYTASRLSGL